MFKKNLLMAGVILFIGISLIISSYFIRGALKFINMGSYTTTQVSAKVLNLAQVASYLNMTEEDVEAIILAEKKKLQETRSFSGKMFPYFTVNSKKYFYKDEIDEWLKEVSSTHREYDTVKGLLFQ